MLFTGVGRAARPSPVVLPCAFLELDNWDDWFKYSTMYSLHVVDAAGEWHAIGSVKIGQFNMTGLRRPEIPERFNSLGSDFFSLGQDDSYYTDLNALGDEIRDDVLNSLRDVALDAELFERALSED